MTRRDRTGLRWHGTVSSLFLSTLLLGGCGAGNDREDPAAPPPVSGAPAPAPAPTPAPSPASPAPLTLPIEVLGPGSPKTPLIVEARLDLDASQLAGASRLYFLCHRCGYYGAPEYEALNAAPPPVKASLRVLGGASAADEAQVPWTDITDQAVTLADNERVHGGVNGGFYTTRITLALDAATRARLVAWPRGNRIQFRFNGTDGETNGFRVLDLQLRNDANANLALNAVRRIDPKAEKDAGKAYSPEVEPGKALWNARDTLQKSPLVSRTLSAACSSCHAADGRDLQYFNYSNNAIVQRSRYHGLSEAQGRQIAAFLRYSLQEVPHAPKAAPWNPPYQPGPGLDCTGVGCETQWAAGAGLEAVLDSAADATKALFGKPLDAALSVSQADVDRVMDPGATMNTREMPIPMQFPDWNAWLPTTHPYDVWPATAEGSFEAGAKFSAADGRKDPNGKYKALLAWLTAHRNPNGVHGDWSHLKVDERVQIKAMFTQAGWEGYNYLGGGRGNHIAASGQFGAQVGAANLQKLAAPATVAGNPSAFTTNTFIERSVASMLHWNAVKQWEMAQVYGLEGDQGWFLGDKDAASGAWKPRGEAHGWPFLSVSLFFLAPHMVYQQDTDATGKITREWYNGWESANIVGSYYRTNQWYQLQMTVNPGAQSGWVNYSMDWPYLTAFDDYLGMKVGTATPAAKAANDTHYVRLLQARIKSAQYVNNGITLYDPAQPNLINNAGRYGRAQVAKHLAVTNFIDTATNNGKGQSKYRFLDELSPGLYPRVVNGAIRQFNLLYAQTDAAAWRRCDPNDTQLGEPEPWAGFRYCLDARRTPLGQAADGSYFMNQVNYRATTEQVEQYGLWKATQMGADPARLKVWSDWIERMWAKP